MGVGESLLQVGANLINFCCYQRQHGTGDRQWAHPKLADAIRTLGRTAIELRGICLVFLQQLPNKLIDREFISEPVETISLMKQRGILTLASPPRYTRPESLPRMAGCRPNIGVVA